jgi:hypothetical protein
LKTGTLKKAFLTIVFCFSNREMRRIGSRYDRWLQTMTDERMVRTSSRIFRVTPGVMRPSNRKNPWKKRQFKRWKAASRSARRSAAAA